jgi:hypothetical protein
MKLSKQLPKKIRRLMYGMYIKGANKAMLFEQFIQLFW